MAIQKQDAIKESFKKKKRNHIIITIVIFATAFFAFWFSNNRAMVADESTRTAITYGIAVLALGGLAALLLNWRCPACKKYLGRSSNPKVCRKCGAKLQ
ncbi:MAG: hypothetical protein KA369_13955 [Spirochaetes bacterium]|nr:hypothetical protein [Spirochaetota bacterium]